MTAQEAFEAVAHHFQYDRNTGAITRLGRPTGTVTKGYLRLKISQRTVAAHRAAWFLTHGAWPSGQIDHINGDQADNRLVNLRDVSASLNRMNQCRRSDNKSGVTGVSYRPASGKWTAQICAFGKRRFLGRFNSLEAAAHARTEAQKGMPFGPHHGAWA